MEYGSDGVYKELGSGKSKVFFREIYYQLSTVGSILLIIWAGRGMHDSCKYNELVNQLSGKNVVIIGSTGVETMHSSVIVSSNQLKYLLRVPNAISNVKQ